MIQVFLVIAIIVVLGMGLARWQLSKAYNNAKKTIEELNATITDYRIKLAQTEGKLGNTEDNKHLLESAQAQFKVLANEILEEKTKRFTEQNQIGLSQLLTPLRENIQTFQQKLDDIHKQDIAQQATLKNELQHIKELNSVMTKEAHELATALKGHAKQQGTWGETVLGNILERSGLREDRDFKTEKHFTMVEGNRRPDVVVYLPHNKHLIIDAKVSLNDYLRYINAEDEIEKEQALKGHVKAISDRIKELSDRDYFRLPGLNSPEIVFMFVPIESAFVEALRANDMLFQKAIEEQHVLVATPTTLLTSLNIVKQLWRFEEQNSHTKILAEQAGKFHNKLTGFLESLLAVGQSLDKSKEIFERALGQFYSGKNNLINQAKTLEKLGVSVQKKLPEELVDKATMELSYISEISEIKRGDDS